MNFQQEDVFWLCKPRLPSCKFGQVLHSLNPSPLPHPLKVNGKDNEENNNNETKTNKFFLSTLHFQLLLTPCGQFNQLIGRFHEVMGSAMFVQFCKCLFWSHYGSETALELFAKAELMQADLKMVSFSKNIDNIWYWQYGKCKDFL